MQGASIYLFVLFQKTLRTWKHFRILEEGKRICDGKYVTTAKTTALRKF